MEIWVIFIGHGAPSEDGVMECLSVLMHNKSTRPLWSKHSPREVARSIGTRKERNYRSNRRLLQWTKYKWRIGPRSSTVIATADLQTGTTTGVRKNDEFAGPLPGADRPAFSYLTLGALQGWGDNDNNGEVTAQEVQSYATKALQSTLLGRQQNPQVVGATESTIGFGSNTSPDFAEVNLNMRSWEEAKKEELLRGDKLFAFKGNYKSLSSFGWAGLAHNLSLQFRTANLK